MRHTAQYNGMVWQVRGPLAETGDDFQTRADALAHARTLDARQSRANGKAVEWCEVCQFSHAVEPSIAETRLTASPRYGNASGYGPRQPSGRMVRLDGERRWRRVYVTIYGNSGSPFYIAKGQRVPISDCDLPR